MKALVLYDSNFGNTAKIAEVIAHELGTKATTISDVKPDDLPQYDLLVLGTPINGWMPTVGMQVFLDKLPLLDGVKATSFDTRVKLFIHGDAMGTIASVLERRGAELIVEPMPFYVAGPQETPYIVDGEIEKAGKWARDIKKALKTT